VLEFARDHPAKAHALTIAARRQSTSHGNREQEVIGHLAALLGEGAPSDGRASVSTDVGLVEAVTAVIRGHLLAETTGQLPDLLPDLVYLVLMPYAGIASARRRAKSLEDRAITVQKNTISQARKTPD
jgi:hypothetical protein